MDVNTFLRQHILHIYTYMFVYTYKVTTPSYFSRCITFVQDSRAASVVAGWQWTDASHVP